MDVKSACIKGKYYDYNGVEGAPVIPEGEEPSELEALASSTIVDFIMSVGNKPMVDGAEKFGYIYVDTDGTTYVDSHPDADGHRFIADKIIEALPDPIISKQFDDVKTGHKHYNAIEYVVANGIKMKAVVSITKVGSGRQYEDNDVLAIKTGKAEIILNNNAACKETTISAAQIIDALVLCNGEEIVLDTKAKNDTFADILSDYQIHVSIVEIA